MTTDQAVSERSTISAGTVVHVGGVPVTLVETAVVDAANLPLLRAALGQPDPDPLPPVNPEEVEALTALVRASITGEFRPCVLYHAALDMTTVLIADVSHYEEVPNAHGVTVLRANHGDMGVVGIQVWGRLAAPPPPLTKCLCDRCPSGQHYVKTLCAPTGYDPTRDGLPTPPPTEPQP